MFQFRGFIVLIPPPPPPVWYVYYAPASTGVWLMDWVPLGIFARFVSPASLSCHSNQYTSDTNNWAAAWQNLFMPYANNNGADQPVQLRSLISPFIVCCLNSITPLVAISKISRL